MNAYNSQMADKLNNVRNTVRRADEYHQEERNSRFSLPSAESIGVDGVDHINISTRSATEFGIILDQFQNTPFEHPVYGFFSSIEAMWQYLRSANKDNRIRTIVGYRAKPNNDSNNFIHVDDFRYIIMNATWHKIQQYPVIYQEMKDSTLPFDMYFLYKNNPKVRIRTKAAFWMVMGMEEIRKSIKENRPPNLNFLLDVEGSEPPDLSGNFVKQKSAKLTGRFIVKTKKVETVDDNVTTNETNTVDTPILSNEELQISHKDGDNSNNDLDNLECKVLVNNILTT
jgi:hypothetical protein